MSSIAKALGVSTVTVSRALSGKEGVSGDLGERIRRKAKKMGYQYSRMPQNTPAGRRKNIGILIGEKYLGETAYYWLFFLKLLSLLKERNYMGVLEVVTAGEELSLAPPGFIRENKVDGVILLGQLAEEYLKMVHRKAASCVFLDFYSNIEGCDCIVSNNFMSSYSLTRLLIGKGHRKIAFIGSSPTTTSIVDRYMGFCKAMMEEGLPYDEGIPDRDSKGYGYGEINLQLTKYTAYVCNNNQLAGDVIRQIQRNSMKIPEDISIAGFDNADTAITNGVSVTSVEANIDVMCEAAVNTIIKHIENEDYIPHGNLYIDAKIIEKQSIAAPKPETAAEPGDAPALQGEVR